MMELYADKEYYEETYRGTIIPEDELEGMLASASRHIDTLTYNRIVARGIDTLTDYQKDTVKRVCCELAEFEYENKDMIQCVLKNYSINGVSMAFGNSWNVQITDGVAIRRDIYERLCSTGLCSRILRR